MNRFLTIFNFLGVLALSLLCFLQWRVNRALNLEVIALERDHQTAVAQLAEQDKTMRGLTADLTELKEQVSRKHTQLQETERALSKAEGENVQLRRDTDQLRSSVTNWAQAVTLRDERLKEANERIVQLSERLTEAVQKYNTLASNYNAVVKKGE